MLVVVDASTVVGAALKSTGIPRLALLLARERHVIALSGAVFAEIEEVLNRPKFFRVLTVTTKVEILGLLTAAAVWVNIGPKIEECRDPGDDIYLELAYAARADVILSSDHDLLVLDPWRDIRIIQPREFLAVAGEG